MKKSFLFIVFGNISAYILLILWITLAEPLLKEANIQFEGILPTGSIIRGIISYGFIFFIDIFYAIRSKTRFSIPVWLIGVILWFICFMIYTPPELFCYGTFRDIIGNYYSDPFTDFLAVAFEKGTLLYSTVYNVVGIYIIRIIPFLITRIITVCVPKNKKS